MSDLQFEALRADLEGLSVPQGQARNLRWLAATLAVGRTTAGDYEVFIRGPELRASSQLVRRHIQHSAWRPEQGGESFPASRIVLPSAPHFASIAALVAIELLRAGIGGPRGAQLAFTDVEPIIEMAIRRGALTENVVIGLIGELTVLRQLILACGDRPATMMRCLDYWQGWQEGGRDFRIGDHSIEVKTTQASSSIHEFSGLHQLEPTLLPSGVRERLHLMSIGLSASTAIGETLPSMVNSIVALLSNPAAGSGVADEFVRRVSLYGASLGRGYLHSTMQNWSVYGTHYVHTFGPRLYRVEDPAMLLLSRSMLAETFVQPDGLAFKMHFPDQVSAFNPSTAWESELAAMERA